MFNSVFLVGSQPLLHRHPLKGQGRKESLRGLVSISLGDSPLTGHNHVFSVCYESGELVGEAAPALAARGISNSFSGSGA